MRKLNIGLTDEQRHGVTELLNKDLSNTYLLIIKTKKISLGCHRTSIPFASLTVG